MLSVWGTGARQAAVLCVYGCVGAGGAEVWPSPSYCAVALRRSSSADTSSSRSRSSSICCGQGKARQGKARQGGRKGVLQAGRSQSVHHFTDW
jgi:hypothetical protein